MFTLLIKIPYLQLVNSFLDKITYLYDSVSKHGLLTDEVGSYFILFFTYLGPDAENIFILLL